MRRGSVSSSEVRLGRDALVALTYVQEAIEAGDVCFLHEAIENVIVGVQALVTRLEELHANAAGATPGATR
jgi:hypothetical protein